MAIESEQLIDAFLHVAMLSKIQLRSGDVRHELLPAPHRRPRGLPDGCQVVYAFLVGDCCLKVGKAGPKTKARFTSQHYGMNAPSTLAKSILRNPHRLAELLPRDRYEEVVLLDQQTVGHWIASNTDRFHVFIPASVDPLCLGLLESFVQCWTRALYEGKVM